MRYNFKALEEIGWSMAVAGGIFIFELLANLDPNEALADPKTYGVAALGGLVRAVFAAGLARIRG